MLSCTVVKRLISAEGEHIGCILVPEEPYPNISIGLSHMLPRHPFQFPDSISRPILPGRLRFGVGTEYYKLL